MGGNPGDKAGNITDVIYPDGSKETTEYDILGRTIKVIPRTGLTTEYTYDVLGNVTSVRQGDQFTQYEYDLPGRLTKTITADGSETAYEYDALGNLITSTDPLGNSTAFAYTPESLLEKVTYANGSQQSLTYDLAGNITSETDAEGYTKRYHYDAVNRLVGVTDELGHKTSYTYDPTDNIAQVKDALGHITDYTYDANGNLTSETDALGNTVKYQYTPEGWLEKVIKADGKEITFEYDRTGNLLTQHAGDEYTISSGYNELGQVMRVSSEAGVIEYQYDDRGYLISVRNVNGETISYTYDQYGNKESMTYPDGRTVWYTYDAMNRMVSVKDLDGEITHYSYDAAGRRTKSENSTLTTAYEYDIVGNLIRQETSGISSIAFSYSHNKNRYITGEVRYENGETTESQYGYDALGQLVSFRQSTGYGEQYTYDAAGNMTKKVISPEQTAGQKKNHPVTVKMKYNQGNQLMEMAVGKNKISYSYDPNGSMIQKVLNSQNFGTLTDEYTYDVLDQFTGYYGYDGYVQILAYDANGMRLSKKEKGNTNRSTLEELLRGNIPGLPEVVEPAEETIEEGYEWATTKYLYDITQEYYQVIQETTTNENGSSTTAYSYGLERIAAYSDKNKTAYAYDGRGSVAQAVTMQLSEIGLDLQNGMLQATSNLSYKYTPFGEQQNTKASGFTYNAEAYDAATGMLNLRARQYEVIFCCFQQLDAFRGNIMNSDTLNRHTYCINNPICYADPSGLRYMDALMIADGGGKKTKANHIANTPSVETQLKQLKEKAKKASVKKIDSVTTRNSYEYYIHSNYAPNNILYEKVPQNRKNAENKLFEFARRIPDSKSVINMQCATYVYDAYYSAKTGAKTIIGSYLFNAIPALGRRATSSYTVPQYAAFAGEYTRDQYNYEKENNKKAYTTIKDGEKPVNNGYIGDCVLMVVSINVGEGIKVKMPGSTQFMLIEGTENVSLRNQLQYVLDSGILVENDIVYFVSEGGTNSKTKQDEYYPPDIGQVHVGVMATTDTYSAANGYVFRKPIVEAVDTYVGMDFIILNSDIETIELMRTLYGGGVQ